MRTLGTKAFTLIEILTVVTLLAILAVIAVPAYQTYIIRSKSAEAPMHLQTLVNLELAWIDKPRVDPGTGRELYTCWVTSSNRHPVPLGSNPTSNSLDWMAPIAPPAAFTALGFRPSSRVYYTYSLDGQTGLGAFVIQNDGNGYCKDGVGTGLGATLDLTNQTLRARAIADLDGDWADALVEGVFGGRIGRYARVITTAAGIPSVGPLISQDDYE